MKITIDFRGTTYIITAEHAESLVQRIEKALATQRNPAELVLSAALSGVNRWDANEDSNREARLEYQAFLQTALNGECGISPRQIEKAERALREFGYIYGENAIEKLRDQLEQIREKHQIQSC